MSFENSDLTPLVAVGGNSRMARSERAKRQLRDKYGRWVEMGRSSKIDAKFGGKLVKIIGKFVGGDPKAPGERGLFLVQNDPNGIPDGVYSFKGRALQQVLASLDETYLRRRGITDPKKDVNDNLIGKTLDADIDNVEDVYREDIGELDITLAKGLLDPDNLEALQDAREEAGDHQSYNVVATLEEADEVALEERAEEGAKAAQEAIKAPAPEEVAPAKKEPEAEAPATPNLVNAGSLKPGDRIVRRGEVKTVQRVSSVDSGDMVYHTDGTYHIYEGNEKAELAPAEEKPAVKAEIPAEAEKPAEEPKAPARRIDPLAPPVGPSDDEDLVPVETFVPTPTPEPEISVQEGFDIITRRENLRKVEEALGRETTPAERIALGSSLIGVDAFRGVNPMDPDVTGAKILEAGQTLATFLNQNDPDRFEEIVKSLDVRFSREEGVERARTSNEPEPEVEAVPDVIETKVKEVLDSIKRKLGTQLPDVFDDLDDLYNPDTQDPELRVIRDMAYYMTGLIEQNAQTEIYKDRLYRRLADDLVQDVLNKANAKAGKPLDFRGKADTVRKVTARKDGATIDPLNMTQPRVGIAVAEKGLNEEIPDTLFFGELGDYIVADYVERNKDKLKGGFKLGTWHDKENNEVTLDIIKVYPPARRAQAEAAGQANGQQGIFDLKTKEYIPTGGTGGRGNARRQRELDRGEVRVRTESGRELGQPDSGGESREGKADSTSDAGAEEELTFTEPDGSNFVPIFDRANIELDVDKIDTRKLKLSQRVVLRKLIKNRERMLKALEKAAREKDSAKFQKYYSYAAAATDVVRRYVRSSSPAEFEKFGSGENERLKNMVFFEDSLQVDQDTGRITKVHGLYTNKQGNTFYLKYDQSNARAAIHEIAPDGSLGSEVAFVNISWMGEQYRGPDAERNVSISYLSSSREGQGLGAIAVTFARYVVEGSGREFAHSSCLTNMGANNSKAIEPNNPMRHHYSQAEKVMWMMKVPTIGIMRDLGWFTRNSPIGNDMSRFERPIDVSGRTSDSSSMAGPLYQVDRNFSDFVRSAIGARALGDNALLKNYVDNGRKSSDISVQFMIEDLNWKDGISKADAIAKLREFQEAARAVKTELLVADDYAYRNVQQRADRFINLYGSLADALEADDKFDEKRQDRPKKLDRDAPRQIRLFKEDGQFDAATGGSPAYKGMAENYYLHRLGEITTRGYNMPTEAIFTKLKHRELFPNMEVPSTWTSSPDTLARRFDSDVLFEALAEGIKNAVNPKPDQIVAGALLDFRRDYATEPALGYVSLASVAAALDKQGAKRDGVEVSEWLAEQIDKANGFDDNIKAVDSYKQSNQAVLQKIEEFLQGKEPSEQEQNLETLGATPEDAKTPKYYFDRENGAAVSDGEIIDTNRENFDNDLISNEVFDLPGGLGEVLAQPAPFIPMSTEEVARNMFGATLRSERIATRFRKEDLADALIHAIDNEKDMVQLTFPASPRQPDGYTQPTPIVMVRDALQKLGVDTNGLIRQRAKALNEPAESVEQIQTLAMEGRATPVSPEELIANMRTVVDISLFTNLGAVGTGVTDPHIFLDPATGQKYLVKRFRSDRRRAAENEILTQSFYRLAGIDANVPQFGRKDGSRDIYIVSKYLPANPDYDYKTALNSSATQEERDRRERVRQAVINGLPVDILIDNIDGAFNSGNVLIGPNGEVTRIDGGGGLTQDPVPNAGTKKETERYNWMRLQGRLATDEDDRILQIAKTEGTFEGDGIEFGWNFYLDPQGYHWNVGGGQRRNILDGLTDEQIEQSIREVILPLTPDKLRALASGAASPDLARTIGDTLVERRKKILDRYDIEDTYDYDAEKRAKLGVDITDLERLRKYIGLYQSNENDYNKVSEFTSLLVDNSLTKGQVDVAVQKITDRLRQYGVTVDSTESEDKAKKDEAAESLKSEPVETNLPTVEEGLPVVPATEDNVSSNIKPSELQKGDKIVVNDKEVTVVGVYNKQSSSVNNGEPYKSVMVRDADKKVSFTDFYNDEPISQVTRPAEATDESQFLTPDALASRQRQLNRLSARSNKVIDDVKSSYPNAVQLANGDLVVASRNFTTAGGKHYRYEVLVHRKPNEEFVTYVREIELDGSGNAIGEVRINKMSTQTHSSLALLNRVAPLLRGDSAGKGVYGSNPRNWFNQGSFDSEVINPATGLPLPRSLAPKNLNVQYIPTTGIEMTGDPVKDALISHISDLVERGMTDVEILRRLNANGVLSSSKIVDFIERIQANRAFPGVNQIPYVSRNGKTIVREGDRVRHYAPDGTIKEGVVRKRRSLSVSQKAQGVYGYTDVLVVKFDNRAQGTPIVASNLEVLSRRNGELPEELSERQQNPKQFTEPTKLPEGWTFSIENDEAIYSGPDSARSYVLSNDPTEDDPSRVNLAAYPSIKEGRDANSSPSWITRFSGASMAQTFAEALVSRDANRLAKASAPAPQEPVTNEPENAGMDIELPPVVDEEPEEMPNGEREQLAYNAAKAVRDRAKELEPKITRIMALIASRFDGRLEGLGYRLKSTKSLLRKILKDADNEFGGDIQRAAENVSDAVRYTTVVDTEKYTESIEELIKVLEAEGYKLRIKNFWTDDPTNTYRGVNIKLTKDGVTTELQIHTPNSLEEKEARLHDLYEEIRVLDPNNPADAAKIENLAKRMADIAAGIPKPANYVRLQRIGDLLSQSFT